MSLQALEILYRKGQMTQAQASAHACMIGGCMCTAVSDHGCCHLFGRTLDIECSYGEVATVTPRNFRLDFLHEKSVLTHPAIMGIACIRHDVPLYYDAINETGLAVAGLNFPSNAVYHAPKCGMHNVASFELIPWILSQCETLPKAIKLLQSTNITGDCVSAEMPATPLHWIIADKTGAVTVESVASGLAIYENPFGVLTNNPTFPYHQTNIANFMHLDSRPSQNNLCPKLEITSYSRGMGALGLPGDFSSSSRFVRAVFAKNHTACANTERSAVGRFFHVMDSVCVPSGCVKTDEDKDVRTVYTSCANTDTFTYYFTTYSNRRIRAVHVRDARLDTRELLSFPLQDDEDILYLEPS